jgi:hypothetical protein
MVLARTLSIRLQEIIMPYREDISCYKYGSSDEIIGDVQLPTAGYGFHFEEYLS